MLQFFTWNIIHECLLQYFREELAIFLSDGDAVIEWLKDLDFAL